MFKAGAVVLLLLGLVHSLSLVQKLAASNETERQLLDLLDNYKFNLVGSHRTMSDLFQGFSTLFTVTASVWRRSTFAGPRASGIAEASSAGQHDLVGSDDRRFRALFLRGSHIIFGGCPAHLCRSLDNASRRGPEFAGPYLIRRKLTSDICFRYNRSLTCSFPNKL